MFKRLILAVSILCLILAACESDDNAPAQQASPVPPTPFPITLVVWYADPALTPLIERLRFEEDNPSVTVEWTLRNPESFLADAQAALDAGAGPDALIFPLGWLPALRDSRLLVPLDTSVISTFRAAYPQRVFETGLENPDLRAFPIVVSAPVLYYQDGNPSPDYDTFITQAQERGAVIVPDFITTSAWIPSQTWDEATLTAYFTRIQAAAERSNVTFTRDDSAFMNGEAAFYVGTSGEFAPLQAVIGEDLLTLPLEGVGDALLMGVSLNATYTHFSAAHELMRSFSEIQMPLSNPQIRFLPLEFYSQTLSTMNQAIQSVREGVLTPAEAAQQVLQSLSSE